MIMCVIDQLVVFSVANSENKLHRSDRSLLLSLHHRPRRSVS